jgi:hypothetical protein
MNEKEVVFTSEGLRLSGSLTVSEESERSPCVLMFSGSGRVDRNENQKKLPIDVMGRLAVLLAERGIATLRYDKRGVGASEGVFWEAGFYDNVADASAALAFLRTHDRIERGKIFFLGHSEGAYIATRLASETADVAGVVLLAGGARTGEEELRWQAEQVAGSLTGFNAWLIKLLRIDVTKAQSKQLAKIRRSNRDWYRVQLVRKMNAKWMREFLSYDPADDLGRIDSPVLAITGSKDIQVDPGNLERMAGLVTAPFESHVLPDVTHLLRAEAGQGGISTYKKQVEKPVDPRVSDLIVIWLKRQIEVGAGPGLR